MKKYLYFIFFLFLITSCTEDVRFNNPAFQGLKDNVFWRAVAYKAYTNSNGTLTIHGSLGYENIILQVPSQIEDTYVLGVNDVSKASYTNTLPEHLSDFSTGTQKGSGQIVVTDYDIENNTVSGTFKFTAVNSNVADVDNSKLIFTEGVFYKVPVKPTLDY